MSLVFRVFYIHFLIFKYPSGAPTDVPSIEKTRKTLTKDFWFMSRILCCIDAFNKVFFSLRTDLFKCILIRIFGTLWFFILELSKCVSTLYFSMRDKSFPYQLLNVFSDKSNKLFTGISCKKGQLGSIKFSFH